MVLILPGIFLAEFFRHTEADRTLIAWSMLERKDFVLPYLLESPILTKPPLFYWLAALTMRIFNSTAEWVPRLPSAVMAILLIQLQFWFTTQLQGERKLAFLSSLILLTSPLFLQLASSAEIDSTFATLNALSLFSVLLAHRTGATRTFCLAYLASAAAALTKGPVALALTATIDLLCAFRAARNRTRNPNGEADGPTALVRFTKSALRILLLSAAAAIPCILWYAEVSRQVGWPTVLGQQAYEITRRFSGSVTNEHGIFFYPGSLILGALPWTLLALYSLWRGTKRRWHQSDLVDSALLVCVAVLTVLCCAKGKSSRYSLIIYPFLSILLAAAIQRLTNPRLFMLTLVVAVVARIGEIGIYTPLRNYSRTVIPMVEDLATQIDSSKPLYVLEIQKRWVVYYLKERGIRAVRMTNVLAEQLSGPNPEIALLLSSEELWRLPDLERIEPATRIIKSYDTDKSQVSLVRTTPRAIRSLDLQRNFPTLMTLPPEEGEPD